jgi:hypothetical protein
MKELILAAACSKHKRKSHAPSILTEGLIASLNSANGKRRQRLLGLEDGLEVLRLAHKGGWAWATGGRVLPKYPYWKKYRPATTAMFAFRRGPSVFYKIGTADPRQSPVTWVGVPSRKESDIKAFLKGLNGSLKEDGWKEFLWDLHSMLEDK